jgi:hypothetical protein
MPIACSSPWCSDRRAVADLDHGVERVGHEHDRPALALERPDPVEALGLEGLVADRRAPRR